ncbi:SagB/ThcOx family dehydrogenase [Legionella tucsonensis]|uniref:Nitroreductase n=1 Tax=Legionella tucsonensis TaxID=40335 RepID=A0A0W0ZXE3_9GAMM|nr:SagB/ThcOx family dehydrogenase [Legionella tucsonensis]KTD73820.1 nitroreductase [Legionella tucsonensis]
MEKFFWFSLPITLMIIYLFVRAFIGKPMKRRDINMISAIYLIFYLLITAGLGLFWVARMDLPAFDLHYLFGYCLLFLVFVHLWFQLPLVSNWLKRNSPSVLLDETHTQWKSWVKKIFLIIITIIAYSAITTIVYEFITPATIPLIENNPEISSGHRIWFTTGEKKVDSISYIHHQGDLTRSTVFALRFNIDKPKEFKNYPNYPVTALPVPSKRSGTSLSQSLSQAQSNSVTFLNLQNLSDILYYSSGVTDRLNYPGGQLLLRAAASAGALYPNDLYVAAINVKGLKAGIYYYHPANHNLTQIGNQQSLQSLSLASPYPDIQKNTLAIIIITANFDRTIWKYRERSFRYILPDAGHILGNLAVASSSIHLPYVSTSFFDDEQMKTVLSLSPQNEGVLSMVVLGKNKLTERVTIPQFTSEALPKEIQDIELTRLSYKLTSVQWKKGSMKTPKTDVTKYQDDIPTADALIQLPLGSAAKEDTFTIIKNRRSFRQFSNREVSLDDFAGVIRQSFAPLRNPHNVEDGSRVELFVIVSKVKDLAKGVYRYIPEKAALEKIRAGDFSKKIYQAGLSQELLERAAFVIAWSVDLSRIGLLHGERDYRYANLESGIGGETTYLASQARGLGACSVGAFYDEELRAILNTQETEKHVLLLTAVGNR